MPSSTQDTSRTTLTPATPLVSNFPSQQSSLKKSRKDQNRELHSKVQDISKKIETSITSREDISSNLHNTLQTLLAQKVQSEEVSEVQTFINYFGSVAKNLSETNEVLYMDFKDEIFQLCSDFQCKSLKRKDKAKAKEAVHQFQEKDEGPQPLHHHHHHHQYYQLSPKCLWLFQHLRRQKDIIKYQPLHRWIPALGV